MVHNALGYESHGEQKAKLKLKDMDALAQESNGDWKAAIKVANRILKGLRMKVIEVELELKDAVSDDWEAPGPALNLQFLL